MKDDLNTIHNICEEELQMISAGCDNCFKESNKYHNRMTTYRDFRSEANQLRQKLNLTTDRQEVANLTNSISRKETYASKIHDMAQQSKILVNSIGHIKL